MRTHRLTVRPAAILVACSLFVLPITAHAQTPAPTPAPVSTPPADAVPTPPLAEPATAVERAKVHYDRGIQLYAEENFEAALTEFERAYELAPNFRILYSLALIQRHQNNYAAALTNFQRYLREGGTTLSDERRTEVEKEIAVLKPRVASIEITANVAGADVFVDDAVACAATTQGTCVGKSPLAGPVIVNPGRRKIVASKPGYVSATSIVSLVGSDAIKVNLVLASLDRPETKTDVGARNRAIVAWGVTGVLTATTVVTGVFALIAQRDLKNERDRVTSADQLASDATKVKTLSLATDIFAGTAIVSGLVSAYFTVKLLGGHSDDAPKQEGRAGVRVDVGPTGANVLGRF